MYKKYQIGDNEFYLIGNQEDWDEYFGDDNLWGVYGQEHTGPPLQFPCLTWSNYYDHPTGPDQITHNFIYLEDAIQMSHILWDSVYEEKSDE